MAEEDRIQDNVGTVNQNANQHQDGNTTVVHVVQTKHTQAATARTNNHGTKMKQPTITRWADIPKTIIYGMMHQSHEVVGRL